MKNPSIKYGLVLAFLGILIQLFTYAIGVGFMATWYVGLLTFIIIIIMDVIFSLRLRKDNGGYLTFKEAFVKIFLMCLVAGTISALFSMLLFNVIDPKLPEKLNEAVLQKTISMMEEMGASQEQIDQKFDEISKKMNLDGSNFGFLAQLKNYIIGIIMAVLFSLIVASIIKKKRPISEESTPS